MAMGDTDLSAELKQYYKERAEVVLKNLRENYMEGHYSITLNELGVFEALMECGRNEFINPVRTDGKGHNLPREERRQVQRLTLLSDIYLTGSNAITLGGTIVSTDGSGNRLAAMMSGPKKVIIAGCNKIVTDVDAAMRRIRDWTGPINAIRHRLKHSKDDGLGWGVLRYPVSKIIGLPANWEDLLKTIKK